MKKSLIALLLTSLAGAPLLAHAAEYGRVLPEKSQVAFVFRQMNVPVEGQFKRLKGELKFNPAAPATAKAAIDLDLASIDAGSSEANDEVAGKSWFNTAQFPTARFASTAVKPLGGNRFEVTGTMTIKGRTKTVVAPATFTEAGGTATFAGSFVLRRDAFGIGEGMWADPSVVANEIDIKFRIVAAAGN